MRGRGKGDGSLCPILERRTVPCYLNKCYVSNEKNEMRDLRSKFSTANINSTGT